MAAGRGQVRDSRATLRPLALAALVAVAVLAAALAGTWHLSSRAFGSAPVGEMSAPAPSAPAETEATSAPQPSTGGLRVAGWLGWVVAALVLALVLRLVVGWLWRRAQVGPAPRLPDEQPPLVPDAPDAERAMAAGVRAAVAVLDDDLPPGDAVIAAWLAVEHAAERVGHPRARAQTATELAVEVLAATAADPVHTHALLALYLDARYSRHPVGAAQVGAARGHLAALADGLRTRRDAPAADVSTEPDASPTPVGTAP